MREIFELLTRVGNRPAKHGSRWICATCPPGKAPALKVDGEVFYCHWCQVGGNLVRPRRTPEQRRLKHCARVLASLIKQWEKSQRRWLSVQLRNATDRQIAAEDRGHTLLRDGFDVEASTIDESFNAAQERDWYTQWLDCFDRLTPAELVAEYLAFQDAVHSPAPNAVVGSSATEANNAI